jgi:regulator of protease activity HflC (stomatin/prohibitin superfamily)
MIIIIGLFYFMLLYESRLFLPNQAQNIKELHFDETFTISPTIVILLPFSMRLTGSM